MPIPSITRAEALLRAAKTKDSDAGYDVSTQEAKEVLGTLRQGAQQLRGAKAVAAAEMFSRIVFAGNRGAVQYSKNFINKYMPAAEMSKSARKDVLSAAFPELYEAPDYRLARKVKLDRLPSAVAKKLAAARKKLDRDQMTGGGFYAIRLRPNAEPVGYAAHGIFESKDADYMDGYGGQVYLFDPAGKALGDLYDFAT